MTKSRILLGGVLMALALVPIPALQAAAATSVDLGPGTVLDIAGGGRVLPDPDHDQVFVSGGPFVEVVDRAGTWLKSIGGFVNASGLAIADGKLYVAQSDNASIGIVDTADLDAPPTFVDAGAPLKHAEAHETSLAVAGGRLWFRTGSCTTTSLTSMDLGTHAIETHADSAPTGCPLLATSPTDPEALAIAGIAGSTAPTVQMDDVSAGDPVEMWHSHASYQNGADLGFSADGSEVLLAVGRSVEQYDVVDGTITQDYLAPSDVASLATTPSGSAGGTFAVGFTSSGELPDVMTYSVGVAHFRNAFDLPPTLHPVRHSMAIAPDSSAAYVLAFRDASPHFVLEVLEQPVGVGSYMTTQVTPKTPTPAAPVSFTGRLVVGTGNPEGLPVDVSRSFFGVVQATATVTTSVNGTFAWEDTLPETEGQYVYTATWNGDTRKGATDSTTVSARRDSVYLTLRLAKRVAHVGDTVQLSGFLYSPSERRVAGATVHLMQLGPGQAEYVEVDSQVTDENGHVLFVPDLSTPGKYLWKTAFDGNVRHRAGMSRYPERLSVSKRDTRLSLFTMPATVAYGHAVNVHVHLGAFSDTDNQAVSIAVQPPGGTRRLLTTGELDEHGSFVYHWDFPTKNAHLVATWSGDPRYNAATVFGDVHVQVVVTGRMVGADGVDGDYAVYAYDPSCPTQHTGCAMYEFQVAPPHTDGEIYVEADVFIDGAWRDLGSVRPHRLGPGSKLVIIFLLNENAAGHSFRTRASFDDADHVGGIAPWSYFKITGSAVTGGAPGSLVGATLLPGGSPQAPASHEQAFVRARWLSPRR